ncbi:MAG: class I SAM-dependent methyltransferase [Devosia sp.]|nr:class I SAM-dependent methyltransferase [Devosia sp.]
MSLQRVDYDDHQHRVYAKARSISADMLLCWMEVFAAELPSALPLALLDLGSGTGRFSPALADCFGGPVFGVEPSAGMRAVASANASHPAVTYLEGEAADIPLGDATVDGVLMFLSFHHVQDKPGAVREIARVLKPSGRILLRGVFSDRPPPTWYQAYFPRLEAIQAAMFPTLLEVLTLFGAQGFRQLAYREIEEQYSESEAQAVEQLRLRGISTFDHLSDKEITSGFARMDRDLEDGRLHPPLTGRSDLLVLGR